MSVVMSPYSSNDVTPVVRKRKEFYISDHDLNLIQESVEVRSGSGSDEQSSIGVESDSDLGSSSVNSSLFCATNVEEGEEVESKGGFGLGLMGSFDSLEESLPIKRGLSSFFSGKSKSFASLSSVASCSTATDLSKPENPFNKRRRILMSCNRRASYSSLISSLPPLLSPEHKVEEESEEEEEQEKEEKNRVNTSKFGGIKERRAVISPRSFSLSDLQHV